MRMRRAAIFKAVVLIVAVGAVPAFAAFSFDRFLQADPFARPRLVETLGRRPGRLERLAAVAGERLSSGAGASFPVAAGRQSAPVGRRQPRETATVPILVYHHVRAPSARLSPQDRQYEVTPEQLEEQLRLLRREGFDSVSFRQLADALELGGPLPERPVIISFDDGRESQYVSALPLLRKYGYGATFFIFTNAIGKDGYFSWPQLQELVEQGMEIGSHGILHQYMTGLGDAALREELEKSKATLENGLGSAVTVFAHPFGLHDGRTVAAVGAAGYRSARGLDHVAVHSRAGLLTLGAYIVTADPDRFRRIIAGQER